MNTKSKSPRIISTPVKQKSFEAESEIHRKPPSLLFPAWTIPTDSVTDPEQFENHVEGCWEYRRDCSQLLNSYDIIAGYLRNVNICGINPKPGVSIFWKEIRNAQHHVFMFDSHIRPEEFCRILCLLKQREKFCDARTIKLLLLTEMSKQTKNTMREMYNTEQSNITKTHVCILPTHWNSSFYIHDRFALIDDNIWHFGATIGAMHRSYNAFSGPWHDNNRSMLKFFLFLAKLFANGDFIGTPFLFSEEVLY